MVDSRAIGEGTAISASQSVSEVSITFDIRSLKATKLGEESAQVKFDVNVKLEEKERKTGSFVTQFLLTVSTKPSVVKFEVEGLATLTGKTSAIDQMMEVDPKTNVPFLLHRIYQHVFESIYLLSSIMKSPYPPPDLLYPSSKGGAGEGPSK